MGKSRKGQMSERQLRMIEFLAEGKSYAEVGRQFGITASGARDNVRVAANLLLRHDADAFPPDVKSSFSVEELLDCVPGINRLREIASKPLPASKPDIDIQTLSVKTPMGDIVVSVKTDSEYPGVYIDLKGPGLNDQYEKDSVGLAWVEFEPNKNKIQTVVYGDGNKEDFTHLIEHENLLQRELAKPTLSDQISSASSRASNAQHGVQEPFKSHVPNNFDR